MLTDPHKQVMLCASSFQEFRNIPLDGLKVPPVPPRGKMKAVCLCFPFVEASSDAWMWNMDSPETRREMYVITYHRFISIMLLLLLQRVDMMLLLLWQRVDMLTCCRCQARWTPVVLSPWQALTPPSCSTFTHERLFIYHWLLHHTRSAVRPLITVDMYD